MVGAIIIDVVRKDSVMVRDYTTVKANLLWIVSEPLSDISLL